VVVSKPLFTAQHVIRNLRIHLFGFESVPLSVGFESRCVARPGFAFGRVHWHGSDCREQVVGRVRDQSVAQCAFAVGSFGVGDCALGGGLGRGLRGVADRGFAGGRCRAGASFRIMPAQTEKQQMRSLPTQNGGNSCDRVRL